MCYLEPLTTKWRQMNEKTTRYPRLLDWFFGREANTNHFRRLAMTRWVFPFIDCRNEHPSSRKGYTSTARNSKGNRTYYALRYYFSTNTDFYVNEREGITVMIAGVIAGYDNTVKNVGLCVLRTRDPYFWRIKQVAYGITLLREPDGRSNVMAWHGSTWFVKFMPVPRRGHWLHEHSKTGVDLMLLNTEYVISIRIGRALALRYPSFANE